MERRLVRFWTMETVPTSSFLLAVAFVEMERSGGGCGRETDERDDGSRSRRNKDAILTLMFFEIQGIKCG